jgi:urease accessory protein
MKTLNSFGVIKLVRSGWQLGLFAIATTTALFGALPAVAHHAMDGKMPANFFEGAIAGIAHPLIGFDHFAFIVAVGLLAATRKQGIWIPIAFVLAAMAGTGIHLAKVSVPGAELFIAGSILGCGLLLALNPRLNGLAVAGLGAISGLFHGYAYGEAIVGAEVTPIVAYLIGFTTIQLVVALTAFSVANLVWLKQPTDSTASSTHPLRTAGFMICGIGLAFLMSQILDLLVAGVTA